MRRFIANTDFDWFTFLRARQPLEEVNFWQPSAHGFRAPPGTPFFFKLKAPHNAVAGYGVFARYEEGTPALAWEAFGEKNGATSFAEMWRRITGLRAPAGPGHKIGCIMVSSPVFFEDAAWVPQPSSWKPNIVSGAGADLESGEGRRIWDAAGNSRRARPRQSRPRSPELGLRAKDRATAKRSSCVRGWGRAPSGSP